MSETKRYDVGMTTEFNPHGFNHSFPRVYEAEQGKYVEYADYARLKAEISRLRESNYQLNLKGQAMAGYLQALAAMPDYTLGGGELQRLMLKAVSEWDETAAKEGKQSNG